MDSKLLDLKSAPDIVFRVWNFRLKIELEAARLFKNLSNDLKSLYGDNDPVAQLAKKAADDEIEHAKFCREILSHGPTEYQREPKPENFHISPEPATTTDSATELSLDKKVLYTAIAMGCVTESLSSALLLEMQNRAEKKVIYNIVHQIFTDEIDHSRIGWAELARQKQAGKDLKWIQPLIKNMIQEAYNNDVAPMLSNDEAKIDLSPWGVINEHQASDLMKSTIEKVIYPGLKSFGAIA